MEIQDLGDICILISDSWCCITETDKYYRAIILQFKIFLKKEKDLGQHGKREKTMISDLPGPGPIFTKPGLQMALLAQSLPSLLFSSIMGSVLTSYDSESLD